MVPLSEIGEENKQNDKALLSLFYNSSKVIAENILMFKNSHNSNIHTLPK